MPGWTLSRRRRPIHNLAATLVLLTTIVGELLSKVQSVRLFSKPLSVTSDCPHLPTVREYMDPLRNVSLGRLPNNGDYTASAIMNFPKRSSLWTLMDVNITTCPASAGLGTSSPRCTSFGRWKFEQNVCKRLKARNTLWTKIMDAFSPPISCTPKGEYRVENAYVDSRLLEALQPPRGRLWHVDAVARDTNLVPVYCVQFLGVLLYE